MTKAEMIDEMALQLKITKAAAKRAIEKVGDLIVEVLMDEGRFAFSRLGVFTVRDRKARTMTILTGPNKGEKKPVPASKGIHFKAAPAAKKAVNE